LNIELTLAISAVVSLSAFNAPAFSQINSKKLLNANIALKQQSPAYLNATPLLLTLLMQLVNMSKALFIRKCRVLRQQQTLLVIKCVGAVVPIGTLSNTASATATATVNFTAPAVDLQQIATLEVTVQDPQGNRDKALIEVTISNNEVSPAQPAASNNSNGGGSMGGLVFLLILVVVIRRLTSSQLRQLH
jgi:hypothetical protein